MITSSAENPHFILDEDCRAMRYCFMKKLSMRHDILKISFELKSDKFEYVRTGLFLSTALAEDAVVHPFTTVREKKSGTVAEISATLDLRQISFEGSKWNMCVVLSNIKTGELKSVPIFLNGKQRIFLKFIYNGSFKSADGNIFYPDYTGYQTLIFTYHKCQSYDGMSVIFKEMLALFIYKVSKSYWKKQHVCLVFEKFSAAAQDNGYYFFKHCMDENEETYLNKKIYYIIDKNSPDYTKVSFYGKHVLNFMSVRHMYHLLAADLLVGSDAKYHAYPLKCRHSFFSRYLNKKKSVFLQHGVTAFKQVDAFYGKGKRSGCDLFIVTNHLEEKIVVDNFGYNADEVANTGFARWDVLKDKSHNKRQILVMPTWRTWLDSVSDKAFEESSYFKNYMELLNSTELEEILEKYDLQLYFYLHAKFQNYSDNFSSISDRIHLISFGEYAVNEMLMESRMLITDYSSVCWDMLYQGKPTLFYQFDIDKYEEAHGSYMDMRHELFGDRAENIKQLLPLLEAAVQDNFILKPEYQKQKEQYFPDTDRRHCRLICEAIKERRL